MPANFISVISLGCPKNQVDSENLLGALTDRDVVLCSDPADASVIIVNTCGFIRPAREEGTEVLDECIALRRRGPCRLLAVVGCWVVREEADLRKRFGDVDVWLGLLTPDRIAWLIDRVLMDADAGPPPSGGCDTLTIEADRVRVSPPHWAYLKIADGCDNRCTYCTIPEIRGRLRSKPHADVIDETKRLASEGVREINLVAQDVTAYGHDLDGKPHLSALLEDMAEVDGIEWIRLLYAHPAHFTDDLAWLIAAEPKLCNYVDLPVQHIADRVLAAMGRKVTRADIEALIGKLRERIDDVVLRTTVLVGFPGETDAEFSELCDFLRSTRFERLGCFPYWPETGTPAAALPGRVPKVERLRRADEVMRLQQQIAFDLAAGWVGRDVPVIVDAPGEAHGTFIGRTYADAPDVDGVIVLTGDVAPGLITRARVTGTSGYDLIGIV